VADNNDKGQTEQMRRFQLQRLSLTAFAFTFILAAGCGSDSDSSTQPIADTDAPGAVDDNDPADHDVTDEDLADGDSGISGPTDITNAILANVGADCADYAASYISSVQDINRSMGFTGDLNVTVTQSHCEFSSNAIPNHDFNDGTRSFVNATKAQTISYSVPRAPVVAGSTTALSLRTDNAIFLNGVKLDLLAAGCFGIGDGKIGCFQAGSPFRYDPMAATADFGTDSHNAHTQPDGTYHYHGNPNALFADDGSVSPVVGFAADGFPIYGSFIGDGDGVRKVSSSYAVKSGTRQASSGIDPGGVHDGTFVDDYEYVAGSGDLDECNGMTIDGAYGYYVTDAYPWVLGCFKGAPDRSFDK
jgi:hypothetical protein